MQSSKVDISCLSKYLRGALDWAAGQAGGGRGRAAAGCLNLCTGAADAGVHTLWGQSVALGKELIWPWPLNLQNLQACKLVRTCKFVKISVLPTVLPLLCMQPEHSLVSMCAHVRLW